MKRKLTKKMFSEEEKATYSEKQASFATRHRRPLITIVMAGFLATVISAIAAPQVKLTTNKARVIALNGKLMAKMDGYNSATDPEAKAKYLSQAVAVAKERKVLMTNLVKNEPNNANQASLPAAVNQDLPTPVKAQVEKPLAVEGDLVTLHSDDFKDQKSTLDYNLRVNASTRYRLNFADNPKLNAGNARMRVAGVELAGAIAVPSGGSIVTSVTALAPGAVAKKAAVILINFQDNPVQPYTSAQVKSTVFGSSNSVAAYYREVSYGKQDLVGKTAPDGDVLGWYTISNTQSSCNVDAWAAAANAKAAASGVDVNGYDNIVYFFPYTTCFGWSGLSEMPGRHSWINGALTIHTIGHELGHNYGIFHAAYLSCGSAKEISASCFSNEYGDPFDVMGSAASYHLNNYHKGQLKFSPTAETTAVSASGTYAITPQETAGGTKILKIPMNKSYNGSPTSQSYFLEYRQPYGFDNFGNTSTVVNGVSIRVAPTDYSYLGLSWLVNGNCAASATSVNCQSINSALKLNQTYTDTNNNIIIRVTGLTPTQAIVDITYTVTPPPPPPEADTIPPSVPANLMVSPEPNPYQCYVVHLEWGASTDNVGVKEYLLYRNGVNVGRNVAGFSFSTKYVDCLTANGKYEYYVTAKDSVNESAPSNKVTFDYNMGQPPPPTPPPPPPSDTTKPSTPAGLNGNAVSPTQVNLSWTGSTDNVGVAGYNILRDGVKIATSTTTNFADGTVNASTTYNYTVTAYDAVGNTSAASNTAAVTTPAPPTTSNTVTGKAIASANSQPVAGVTIALYKSSILYQTTVSSSNGVYQFTNIPAGSYKITASATGYLLRTTLFNFYAGTTETKVADFYMIKSP